MRRCKIPPPSCCHSRSAPCCKDCQERDCSARCLNDPARCRCWEDKPPRGRGQHKVDALQVAYLYGQAGLTQAEIAERLGCSRHTVGAILREMGVGRHGQA